MTTNQFANMTNEELVEARDEAWSSVWICYAFGALCCLSGVGAPLGLAFFAIGQCMFGSKHSTIETELRNR